MERSGPDDAWDDSGDPLYPAAPVPAHERTWRHPSEVGKAAWELSEPPVAIGRGLLVTTGAIGSALGVAVLWLLSPMGGSAPSASPTATSAVAVVRTTEPAAPTTDERLMGSSSVAARPVDTIDFSQFTLPAEDVPSTVLVAAPRPQGHASIAVAVGNLPYMLTTATAVSVNERRTTVDIVAPGDPVSADIVSIDGDLAYLEPSSAVEVVSFAEVSTAEPGQTVVVLTDEPTEVTYRADGSAPELDPGVIVEGTPVIDDDGSLVALCTVVIDGDGAWVGLVPVVPTPDGATTDTTADTALDSVPPTDGPTSSVDPTTSTEPAMPSTTAVAASNAGSTPSSTVAGSNGTGSNGTGSGSGTSGSSTSGSGTSNGSTSSTAASSTTVPSGSSTVPTVPVGPTAWAGLRFDSGATVPLVVSGLPTGSPAAGAGVVVGDRIVAVDGVPVATIDELLTQMRKHVPGDVVVFRVASAPSTAGSAQTTGTVTATERSVTITLGAVSPTV